MTKDQANRLIEVLQWIVDGKEVEVRNFGPEWCSFKDGDYVGTNNQYRIKPREPFEFWANVYQAVDRQGETIGCEFQTKEIATSQSARRFAGKYLRTAKFREVLPEDEK